MWILINSSCVSHIQFSFPTLKNSVGFATLPSLLFFFVVKISYLISLPSQPYPSPKFYKHFSAAHTLGNWPMKSSLVHILALFSLYNHQNLYCQQLPGFFVRFAPSYDLFSLRFFVHLERCLKPCKPPQRHCLHWAGCYLSGFILRSKSRTTLLLFPAA